MTGRDMMNRKRIILFLMVLSLFESTSVKADEACKTSAYVFEDPHDSELAMLQVVTRIPENFFRVGDNAVTRLRMTDARRMIFPLSVYQPITEAENAMNPARRIPRMRISSFTPSGSLQTRLPN